MKSIEIICENKKIISEIVFNFINCIKREYPSQIHTKRILISYLTYNYEKRVTLHTKLKKSQQTFLN